MRKTILKMVLSLLCILTIFISPACAEMIELHIGDHFYTVEIPEEYMIYTSELGRNSSYFRLVGDNASPEVLDSYMQQLGSCLVGATLQGHQLWLSIKDRSTVLGQTPGEAQINAFYDGQSVARGKYTVESYNGRNYYVFADGESIFAGGVNFYLSTFIGHYEVSVRWESGNGRRTDDDISLLKNIIHSVQLIY